MRYHGGMKNPTRPPSDRGQGRKPISEDEETVTVSLRMPISYREKLKLIGGAAYLRKCIKLAKPPKPSE